MDSQFFVKSPLLAWTVSRTAATVVATLTTVIDMRRILFALLVSSAPCLAQAAKPAAARLAGTDTVKVGKYDLEITTDDGTMVGDLTVTRHDGKLAAAINAGGRVPAVKSFVRKDNEYVLTAGHDEFTIVYKFNFARDSVAGSFEMSGGLKGTVLGAYKR